MIEKLINQHLTKQQAEPRERSHKFNPSMFGRCYRAQIWNRKNEPQSNPPDERLLRVFKAGSLFHDFVQDIVIKETKAQVEVEVTTEDTKGFADIVTEHEVIDIKSVHSKAFWYMTKSTNIGEDKKPNILQVMWYAKQLKKDTGRLIFVSKDDLCIQEYAFPLSKWVKEVDDELSILNAHWLKGLPEALPRAFSGKECTFCSFCDRCKESK